MLTTAGCGSGVYPEYGGLRMRKILVLACSAMLAAVSAAAIAQGAAPQNATRLVLPPIPKALLPSDFAGWTASGATKKLNDAAVADAANAAALKEYEFTGAELVEYKRGGETLSVRALRFHDASGAYGAYSFYRQNGWPKEQIGAGATSNHNRVLFWVGDTVVDATFSHIGAMSGSELRELAGGLPQPEGGKALTPPILANLPKGNLDGQTTHYAVGPASYSEAGGVLPVELVGFDRGAEAVTANYSLHSGPATLTIIDYPTPQMAAAQETKIRAYIDACKHAGKQEQAGWTKGLQDSDLVSLEVKRSGPLVALVSGDAVPDESHKLLAAIHFEADLTSMQQPAENDVLKTGKLLLGIAVLVLVVCGISLFLGFFLGGFRALYRKSRGLPASSVFDEEFIRIDLRD
jgi:hypothetical protein